MVTIEQAAKELRRLYPNKYSSARVEVRNHSECTDRETRGQKCCSTICDVYVEQLGHFEGNTFADCFRQLLEFRGNQAKAGGNQAVLEVAMASVGKVLNQEVLGHVQ